MLERKEIIFSVHGHAPLFRKSRRDNEDKSEKANKQKPYLTNLN